MLITIKILTWLVLPIGILALSALIGLLLLWRLKKKRWWGQALIALGTLQLLAFSSPFISDHLFGSLEAKARDLSAKNQRARMILEGNRYGAIVLLGGGMRPKVEPMRPFADMGDAADRVWHAARLYRQGLAPKIIVSGGRIPGLESRKDIQTEAQAMKSLLTDFGVPSSAIVIEDQSRNTRENARFTKSEIGAQRAALVTSAFHMPRAQKNFEREGLAVDAFPTDFRVAPSADPLWNKLLPNAQSLQNSEAALKEYIAIFLRY